MIKKIKKYKKNKKKRLNYKNKKQKTKTKNKDKKQRQKTKIKIKKNHIIYYSFHHLFLLQIYLHHFIKDIIFTVFFLYVLQ